MWFRWLRDLIGQILKRGDKIDLSPVGSEHTFTLSSVKFKGIYCSVWFDEPNEYTKENKSVPNAPKYYIDFKFLDDLSYEEVKKKVDEILREMGVLDKVAKWEKSYHVKRFYQAIVTTVDGNWVDFKNAELWCEGNYDGVNKKWNVISEKSRFWCC